MKQKPIITYIKNGVEKTVTLTIWNQRKILNEIYEIYNEMGENAYFFNKDIEFVHFKNFIFNEIFKIEGSEDTLCIFENCIFENSRNYARLRIEGCDFELINPDLNVGSLSSYYDSLNLIYTKDKEKRIREVEIGSCIVIPEGTTNIKDYNNIANLTIYSENISLKEKFDVQRLRLSGANISIGHRKKPTNIVVKMTSPSIDAYEKLSLTNCFIETHADFIRIDAPQIEIENVTLTAKNYIEINGVRYKAKKGEEKITITDKDINRQNLICILKGYKNQLESHIQNQIQQYLDNCYQEQKKHISQLKSELEQQQSILNEMENDLNLKLEQKENTINKSLIKKPIKNL